MSEAPCGVLLSNLGTPDAPTASALRRYLREFLSDPRVVDLPRALWWPILHGAVLPFRSKTSAALYRKIWTTEGSPLLSGTERLARAVARLLGEGFLVEIGMRYGSPSIADGLRRLRDLGAAHLVVLPLYPQYSSATGGSSFDALAAELMRWRVVPDVRVVQGYFNEPAWTAAIAVSIREAWSTEPAAEKLVFSFHGLPRRYADAGDVYPDQCRTSARAIARELGLPADRWTMSFQSRFGRERWLEPYTLDTMASLARSGTGSVDVVCPGFAVDCLETLEEIAMLNRGVFLDAGGQRYRYIPCLGDRADHAALIASVARRALV